MFEPNMKVINYSSVHENVPVASLTLISYRQWRMSPYSAFMDVPPFFGGKFLLIKPNTPYALIQDVPEAFRVMMIQLIDDYFWDRYLGLCNLEEWTRLWKVLLQTLDVAFWSKIVYTAPIPLYELMRLSNGAMNRHILENSRKSFSKTSGEAFANSDTDSANSFSDTKSNGNAQGEGASAEISTNAQEGSSNSVNRNQGINSNFPQQNMQDGTMTFGANNMPEYVADDHGRVNDGTRFIDTEWKYGQGAQEGLAKATSENHGHATAKARSINTSDSQNDNVTKEYWTDAHTRGRQNSVQASNAMSDALHDTREYNELIESRSNNNWAYQYREYLKALDINLPYDWLFSKLDKMFLQVW